MKLLGLSIFLIVFTTNSLAEVVSKSWHFDVFLDDKSIGKHIFTVTEKNNKTYVEVKATFDVKLLFFTAYRYRHENKEVWDQQCLLSIESSTNDNGTKYDVQGQQDDDSFKLAINGTPKRLEKCVRSFFYWDSNILSQRKLLNSQTGEYENIKVEKIGKQSIKRLNKEQMANHYRLHAKMFSIDLWYSDQGEWLSLRSTTEDGNVLNYTRSVRD